MSTPIKPPSNTPELGNAGPVEGPDAGRVEGRPGELRELVEEAARIDDRTQSAGTSGPISRTSIQTDLSSGRIGADEAIERLVQRALAGASGLSAGQRAELEAQLRAALVEDPTLIALKKDLARGSQT